MNIEQLTPDKLRVNITAGELNRYDLDYVSISTDSPGTKRMIRDILEKAVETTSFTAKDCRLLIEVLPGKSDGCVLYLTKMPVKGSRRRALPGQTAKRGESQQEESYILSCESVDDALCAVGCFAAYPDIPLVHSAFYSLDGHYYLTFLPARFALDRDRLCALLADLSEFGDAGTISPVREAVLCEHGSIIKDACAVESLMRYFH